MFQCWFFEKLFLFFYNVVETDVCKGIICVWIYKILDCVVTKITRLYLRACCLALSWFKLEINFLCAFLSTAFLRICPVRRKTMFKILINAIIRFASFRSRPWTYRSLSFSWFLHLFNHIILLLELWILFLSWWNSLFVQLVIAPWPRSTMTLWGDFWSNAQNRFI